MARKSVSPLVALEKARALCAYQERCQAELREKFGEWGLDHETTEHHIATLISDGYLDEERFARAYARGKFRIKKWGRVKIKMELKKRMISSYCIRAAMKEIDGEEYEKTIKALIEKKDRFLKYKSPAERKTKLLRFLLSRGFENDIVQELLV